jgi:hypothetical protein
MMQSLSSCRMFSLNYRVAPRTMQCHAVCILKLPAGPAGLPFSDSGCHKISPTASQLGILRDACGHYLSHVTTKHVTSRRFANHWWANCLGKAWLGCKSMQIVYFTGRVLPFCFVAKERCYLSSASLCHAMP